MRPWSPRTSHPSANSRGSTRTRCPDRGRSHKPRNLLAKAPARLRQELAEDYRRMLYAETRAAVERARAGFVKKWRLRCPPVIAGFEEAGDELFTFLRFPRAQWKALRTTKCLELINEESAAGRSRRRCCRVRTRCSCSFAACCAAGRSSSGRSMAGRIWPPLRSLSPMRAASCVFARRPSSAIAAQLEPELV